MIYESINGLNIPKIGLGTWKIGGGAYTDRWHDAKGLAALRSAIELGYTHFDTAELYGSGHTEELLGRVIKQSGRPREALIITSKVKPENLDFKAVLKSCERSLRRLGMDYLDLYLIHWPRWGLPMAETFGALNQLVRERPFIANNIAFTRRAFDLDRVGQRAFPAEPGIEAVELERNRATIDNIRLWDWRALQDTLRQIQEIRTYYDFPDIDLDRYTINGELRQVMLGTRELNLERLPESSRNWINEKLIYTHGYSRRRSCPCTSARRARGWRGRRRPRCRACASGS